MGENIFVSSIAFGNQNLKEIVKYSNLLSYNLEFSSNLPFKKNNLDLFNEFLGGKLIHNYFPPPENPFVINLASDKKQILNQSIEHCKNNLLRTSENNLPFYSVHAGFCIDPKISSLGHLIKINKDFKRSKHVQIFIESLKELSDFASSNNVKLLIENNVLSEENYIENNLKNIFLCVDSGEIIEIINEVNNPKLGILLDTGHLKVSSRTLGLNINNEVNNILKFVRAVHHSDNDGKKDNNSDIDETYWFNPFMKKLGGIIHVLEVKNLSIESINKQTKLLLNAT